MASLDTLELAQNALNGRARGQQVWAAPCSVLETFLLGFFLAPSQTQSVFTCVWTDHTRFEHLPPAWPYSRKT
jgi:hypothetical protein